MNSTVPDIDPPAAIRSRLPAGVRLLAAAACLAAAAGCDDRGQAVRVQGGDVEAGRRLVAQYQCGACHAIPGVPAATGDAGPSLAVVGRLSYIAGGIPNQPARMIAFLRDPPALKPGTPMPALGLTEQEARHMAAYLYTLR